MCAGWSVYISCEVFDDDDYVKLKKLQTLVRVSLASRELPSLTCNLMLTLSPASLLSLAPAWHAVQSLLMRCRLHQ